MSPEVYKFGGASVKNAAAILNVEEILGYHNSSSKVIVISAMDKTTNKLEVVVQTYYQKDRRYLKLIEDIKNFHYQIAEDLFKTEDALVFSKIDTLVDKALQVLTKNQSDNYNFIYDQVVPLGEYLSTTIISEYLNSKGITNNWLNVKEVLRTNNAYTEARVDWILTEQLIQVTLPELLSKGQVITQGFVGATSERLTTTLGREGSDFTAAIFASSLNAKKLTIWKDVPGILNADPKEFPEATIIPELSYLEAIEMTYYGAKVIHPKTIKPLQNKLIPLEVRSFLNYKQAGTIIKEEGYTKNIPPVIVFKRNQVLISFAEKDFSFVVEDNLSKIFEIFTKNRLRINMMHNAAISFSVSVDDVKVKIDNVVNELEHQFEVKRNIGLELLTIRHYNTEKLEELTKGKAILLEQKTRHTVQVLMAQ